MDDNSSRQTGPTLLKATKNTVSRSFFISSVLVVALGSFIVGTRADSLGLSSLFQSKSGPAQLDLSSVQGAYDVLRTNYEGSLDQSKLIEGAKRGLVEATGDPYTTYFSEKEADAFFNDLEGEFSGIGAELGRRENRLIIVSTLDDSPASEAGLLANDAIVTVNGEDASTWAIDRGVANIRGEAGTTVKLTVRRDQELKEFSIVRKAITNPSVKSEITADNIGILRISRFGENETYALAKQAADQYKSKQVKGVILDLRGNGGGYLNAAQQIAGLWLNNKVVVTQRAGGKVTDTLKTGTGAPLQGIPTVVLIDGGSASASEILAGALKDHNAATLIGQKTFGKGSVQTFKPVPGGGQVKVTIAKWFTPNGRNISEKGIEPDTAVAFSPADSAAGRDPQKEAAIGSLQ